MQQYYESANAMAAKCEATSNRLREFFLYGPEVLWTVRRDIAKAAKLLADLSNSLEDVYHWDGVLAHEHVRGLPPVPHHGEAAEHQANVALGPVVERQRVEVGQLGALEGRHEQFSQQHAKRGCRSATSTSTRLKQSKPPEMSAYRPKLTVKPGHSAPKPIRQFLGG